MTQSRTFISCIVSLPFYPRLLWRGRAGIRELDRGDPATALGLWRSLAAKADPEAQYQIGLLHEAGRGVPQGMDLAMTWVVVSARQWHERAIKWLKRTATNGNSRAEFELATMFRYGIGVDASQRTARKRMQRAAEMGWAEAQVELARMYLHGSMYRAWARPFAWLFYGIPPLNERQSIHWLQVAAKQNYLKAKFFLGLAYFDGMGSQQDRVRAIDLLKETAEQGLEMAQLTLAQNLWNGEYLEQDQQAAKSWFDKGSASAGSHSDPEIAMSLADAFANGWCVERDPAKECYWTAVRWQLNPFAAKRGSRGSSKPWTSPKWSRPETSSMPMRD